MASGWNVGNLCSELGNALGGVLRGWVRVVDDSERRIGGSAGWMVEMNKQNVVGQFVFVESMIAGP